MLPPVDLATLLFTIFVALASFHLGEAFQRHYAGLHYRLRAQELESAPFDLGAPVPKITEFMHLLEQLKLKKRQGWIQYGIPEEKAESIADHMYRMAIMVMLFSRETGVDIFKCLKMALVHDMAEAITTDLTPDSPVTPEEKNRLEAEAMDVIRAMLQGNPLADEAVALWQEYAANETPEAQFVKDLDKAELIYQVVEYEKEYPIDFTKWIVMARRKIRNQMLLEMVDHVLRERPESLRRPIAEYVNEAADASESSRNAHSPIVAEAPCSTEINQID